MLRAVRCGAVGSLVLTSLVGCGGAAEANAREDDAPGRIARDEPSDAGVPPVSSTSSVDAAAPPPSRCAVTPSRVSCSHVVTKLDAGTVSRDVTWQTPATPLPPGGFPVVVLYQGSFGGPSLTWDALTLDTPFGGYYQGVLQASLLDQGFTVVAPEAALGVAWQTNSGVAWDLTSDKRVIHALLDEIAKGTFGPADLSRLYAAGISSGGYMTSRMAVSYAGRFRALAIQSASYATCAGPVCLVPSALPKDHPPTLFLHGERDATVPLFTAVSYHEALERAGVETKLLTDPAAGHAWLPISPAQITDWFSTH